MPLAGIPPLSPIDITTVLEYVLSDIYGKLLTTQNLTIILALRLFIFFILIKISAVFQVGRGQPWVGAEGVTSHRGGYGDGILG